MQEISRLETIKRLCSLRFIGIFIFTSLESLLVLGLFYNFSYLVALAVAFVVVGFLVYEIKFIMFIDYLLRIIMEEIKDE